MVDLRAQRVFRYYKFLEVVNVFRKAIPQFHSHRQVRPVKPPRWARSCISVTKNELSLSDTILDSIAIITNHLSQTICSTQELQRKATAVLYLAVSRRRKYKCGGNISNLVSSLKAAGCSRSEIGKHEVDHFVVADEFSKLAAKSLPCRRTATTSLVQHRVRACKVTAYFGFMHKTTRIFPEDRLDLCAGSKAVVREIFTLMDASHWRWPTHLYLTRAARLWKCLQQYDLLYFWEHLGH
jgi:hypothetical protein